MQIVIGIIAFILILGLIILIHEFGHFIMAKRAKVLCHEFALGMGPIIWKKKKGETTYALRALPIGGFVSMAGEDIEEDLLKDVKKVRLELDENLHIKTIIFNLDNQDYNDLPIYEIISYDILGTMDKKDDELYIDAKLAVEDETEINNPSNEVKHLIVNRDCMVNYAKKQEIQIAPIDRNMSSKSVGQRFSVVFAGPFMNFVLALFIFFVLGVFQGYADENSTKIDKVTKDSPVYEIMDKGDTIKAINGIPFDNWAEFSSTMASFAKGEKDFNGILNVTYYDQSENKEVTKKIYPASSIYAIELIFQQATNDDSANLPIIGSYKKNNEKTKSYKAGLREGDLITKIQIKDTNEEISPKTRGEVLGFFNRSSLYEAQKVLITVQRTNQETKSTEEFTYEVETYSKKMLDTQNIPQTKVQLGVSAYLKFDIVKLLYMPWVETGSNAISIFKTLGLLFTDSSVNIDDFSGPVGIFQLISSTADNQNGDAFFALLNLTGFLSVNVGFVNLLPLPALDGGRLAFIVYEGITKRKPNQKVENIIHTIGFVLLMGLIIFISFSDVLRVFGCK